MSIDVIHVIVSKRTCYNFCAGQPLLFIFICGPDFAKAKKVTQHSMSSQIILFISKIDSHVDILRGAGTRDEPLRTSAWEATSKSISLYTILTGQPNLKGRTIRKIIGGGGRGIFKLQEFFFVINFLV